MKPLLVTKTTISRAEARDALLRSGYLLEARVEAKLRDRLYYVDANASYEDPETRKSRELDIYGMTAEKCGPGDRDLLFGVLLVECINNPQPFVLLTKEAFLHAEEIKLAGLPAKIRDARDRKRNVWRGLMDYLGAEEWHHYCHGRVATQFCSFLRKSGGNEKGWMATHEGGHFDAVRKLCDATDYMQDKHFRSWRFGGREPVNIEVYYPLIVLQGDLFDARTGRTSVSLQRARHLQLRRSAIAHGMEADYQIDVIEEPFLQKYLDLIAKELGKAARLLRRRHRVVRASIDTIVRQASRAGSREKAKEVMEFNRWKI